MLLRIASGKFWSDYYRMSIELWNSRAKVTPEELLLSLSRSCATLGVSACDVYGDYEQTSEQSYLRRFEREVASAFGKDDALFLPSGVMAQQIALQVHFNFSSSKDRAFVCHHTSHLLIHEKDVSVHLLNMKPLVVPAVVGVRDQQPISFSDIQHIIEGSALHPATVIVECPHREIGGKATSFEDLEKLSAYCRARGIALHMDGARLWEALAHYTTCTTSSGQPVTREILCGLFDSIYVSTYKGIGGLTGALLLGDVNFIVEARVWQRRYGGNVYTLLPYAVSAYACFRDYLAWNDPQTEVVHGGASVCAPYSMKARLARLTHLVGLLTNVFGRIAHPGHGEVKIENMATKSDCSVPLVRFDPPVPVVCLIHVYIAASVEAAMAAHALSHAETGVACFARLRPAPVVVHENGEQMPQECYFEFNLGLANGVIADEMWTLGWTSFVKHLRNSL